MRWPLDFTRDAKPDPAAQVQAAVASAALDHRQALLCPSTRVVGRNRKELRADLHAQLYQGPVAR